MRRLLVLAHAASVLLTTAPVHARTEGGDLLWQVDFDLAGGTDRAAAVAAAHGRVVAVGNSTDPGGNVTSVVRAHNGRTGALIWQADFGPDTATSVVMNEQGVFVSSLSLLRAYVPRTGALAWTADQGGGLALRRHHLVVASATVDAAGATQPLVRAYDAKSGTVVWEDSTSLPAGYTGGSDLVTIRGQTAFVAGSIRRSMPSNAFECLIRAYDISSGALLWQTIHDLSSSGFCFPAAIAADGKRVIVGGLGGIVADDYFVLAFDGDSGAFAWQDHQRVGANRIDIAVAVDAERRRAFVAGWISVPTPGALGGVLEAYEVRAYDTKTGDLLWKDELTGPIPIEWRAFDVEASSGRVFAVGQNMNSGLWLVRAYDANDGDVRWEDEFLPAHATSNVRQANLRQSLAVDGGRIFVAGAGFNAAGGVDLILRAYDAK